MYIDKEKIDNLILELGLVAKEDFDVAEREAQAKEVEVWQVLLRKGLLTEDELQNIQMQAEDVSFVDLNQVKIEPAILSIIPEPIVRQHNIVSFDRNDKQLKVAVLDLADLEKIDFLQNKIKLRIVPFLTNKSSLNKAVLQYQKFLKDEYGSLIQKGISSFQTLSEDFLKKLPPEQLLELTRSKQVNRIFELLLKHALLQKVSHIHIEPQENNVVIKYRINGELYPAMVLPKKSALVLALKIKTMAGLKLDAENIFQAGRFLFGFAGKEVNFRVYFAPTIWGERVTLNLLRTGDSGFSLEAAGFQGKALDSLNVILSKKKGMVLIAGGENTGKTTTFYTLIDLLKAPELSIGTIEENIGFQMSGVSQTVVNEEIGFDISSAITYLAKQDYDVMAVDKIEGLKASQSIESLIKLLKFANEDRFALAVVEGKASSAMAVLWKLISVDKLAKTLLKDLDVIILQKLFPALSSKKQEYYLTPAEIKKLRQEVALDKVTQFLVSQNIISAEKSWSEIKFFKSISSQTEKDNKVVVAEVLPLSFALKEKIDKKVSVEQLKKQVEKEDFFSLREDALIKAVQGLISIDAILKLK